MSERAIPLKADDLPSSDWMPDVHAVYCMQQEVAIEASDTQVLPYYWRMGKSLLMLAPLEIVDKEWLRANGISPARATRARQVATHYPELDNLAGISLRKALDAIKKANEKAPFDSAGEKLFIDTKTKTNAATSAIVAIAKSLDNLTDLYRASILKKIAAMKEAFEKLQVKLDALPKHEPLAVEQPAPKKKRQKKDASIGAVV